MPPTPKPTSSGGINPFAAATLGFSIAGTIAGASSQAAQSRASIEAIEDMLKDLEKQKEQLTSAYGTKKQIATDIYGNKVKGLRLGTMRGKEDITGARSSAYSSADLAYSGGIEKTASTARKRTQQDYELGLEGLEKELGSTLADIALSETKDLSQIDIQKTQLGHQKKLAQQTDTFFEALF